VAELEFDVACARGEAARERAGRAAPPAPALDALDALIARAAAGTQGPPARRRRLAPRSGKTLRPFDGAGLVRPAPRAPRPAPRAPRPAPPRQRCTRAELGGARQVVFPAGGDKVRAASVRPASALSVSFARGGTPLAEYAAG